MAKSLAIQNVCFWLLVFLFGLGSNALNAQSFSLAQCLERTRTALVNEDIAEAELQVNRALKLAKESGDILAEVHALILAGDVEDLKANNSEAMALTLEADSLLKSSNYSEDVHPFTFLLEQNMGVHYGKKGRFDKQMYHYQRAYEVAKSSSIASDSLLGESYYNLAAGYFRANNFEAAKSYSDSSIQIGKRMGNNSLVAQNYLNLGYMYAEYGELTQAISYQRKSLDMAKSVRDQVTGRINLSHYLEDLNRFEEAIGHIKQALNLTKERNSPAYYRRAELFSQLARLYFDAGKKEDFPAIYDSCISVLQQQEVPDVKAYLEILNYQGGYLLDQGNASYAIDYANTSLSINQGYYPITAAGAYVLLCESHETLGEFPEAVQAIQASLALVLDDSTLLEQVVDPDLQQASGNSLALDLLMRKADILERFGSSSNSVEKWKAAVATCELVDQIIINSRKQVSSRQSKTQLAILAHKLYSTAITALYHLYQNEPKDIYLEKAFYFSENDKNLLLSETLSSKRATKLAGVPQNMLQEERYLAQKLAYFKNLRKTQSTNSDLLKSWEDSLFILRQKQDQLLKDIARVAPNYYQLKYGQDRIHLDQVGQQLLNDEEVMLHYFLTDQYVYVLVIDQSGVSFERLELNNPLGDQVRELLHFASQGDDKFGGKSYEIYQQILAPLRKQIKGEKLVIVADAAISQIPFDALMVTNNQAGPARIEDYLLHKYSIRRLFSAKAALIDRGSTNDAKTKGNILCITPSFTPPSRELSQPMQSLLNRIEQLPGAQQINKILSQYYAGSIEDWSGKEATKKSFLEEAQKYQAIHLGTHALLDDSNPELSRLIFSAIDEQDTLKMCLHAYEIIQMEMVADLLTLSACNTAIGNQYDGDGIAGLGHAFAFAGSTNLIMTLWPLRDDQAPKIMDAFYSRLSDGVGKAEALRQAKLEYLKSNPSTLTHPYFWAGFTYTGDRYPLQLEGLRSDWLYWLIIGICGLGILLIVNNKRKKQVA